MSIPERPPYDSAPPPWAAGTETRTHELFPKLNEAQLNVLRSAGTEQRFSHGEWLWQVGNRGTPLYAVLEGAIDAVRRDVHGDTVVATFLPGQFTGETTTMAGRASLVSGRARGDLRAIAVPQERLRELMAVNPELGELLMQAFILRRMRMIAEHIGPVTLIGSRYAAETVRLRDFLTRNGTPHEYIDLEQAEDVEGLLEQFNVRPDETPIVLCNGRVLRNPTLEALGECLGTSNPVSEETLYDVAVIGAGPAGLGAAVYASSEGLKVIVLEQLAPGGQAGTSSRIENYLGFPTGISGQALAGRAWGQAQKFGTEFAIPREVKTVSSAATELRVALSSNETVRARTVVIASGVVYRQPGIPGIERFIGGHVHFSASYLESLLCRGEEVAVLGGGNSAGQAAVYLSGHARHVYILVRAAGLADSMSRYLIHRIEKTPNITLLTHTELTALEGEATLERARWRNSVTGEESERPVHHVFVFIGAVPCTDYLDATIARDAHGFIKTGAALSEAERVRYKGAGDAQPRSLETSWPKVFAIGDVRSGSLKRVASAVGDGAAVVALLHEALQS
ncbi:MAG: trxB 1 [Betaproteobacteria bacterium]|jgi:thioredoxin reductase (NADPH)|nr:trxB 1 [Betaproteobacteria bacterium]